MTSPRSPRRASRSVAYWAWARAARSSTTGSRVLSASVPDSLCAIQKPTSGWSAQLMHRVTRHPDPQIMGEEVAPPAIVIAAHEGDGNAPRAQCLQLRDRTEMASWNHGPVLEPEVEQVSVDQQRLAQIGDGLEKAVEGGLDRGGGPSHMGG